jgi:hypothetical protein
MTLRKLKNVMAVFDVITSATAETAQIPVRWGANPKTKANSRERPRTTMVKLD